MCNVDPNIQCVWSELFTSYSLDDEEGPVEDDEKVKYLKETENRQNQLLTWMEELLNSEELQEYFSKKLPKIDAEIQCHMSQTTLSNETDDEKIKPSSYPLTEMSIRKYRIMKKIDCLIKYRNNKAIQDNQLKSIAIIREKIEEAKKLLLCHPRERAIEENNRRKSVFECVKKLLKDELKNFNHNSKLMDKVLAYQKLKRFRKKMRNERRLEVIRKVAREFQRQEQIDYDRNKTYDYRVKPSGFIMKGMEIVGTKATLFERPSDKEKLEEEQEKIQETTEQVNKKNKEKTKDKDSKKSWKKDDKKKKKDKTKKGDKKKKTKEETLVDIVEVLKELQKVLESSEELKQVRKGFEIEKQRKDLVDYPYDCNFTYKPPFIHFKDYDQKQQYKSFLTILNGSAYTRKFRYLKTLWDQPWDTPIFEIEPVGIQKVYPGLSVQVQIIFEPGDRDYLLTGVICFLSYAPDGPLFHFGVPFKCTPFSQDIVMSTSEIQFEKMPIWKATEPIQQSKGKKIIFKNIGSKKCTVSITKVQDPLEIEQKWIFPEEVEEVVEEEEEHKVDVKKKGKKIEGKAKKEKGKKDKNKKDKKKEKKSGKDTKKKSKKDEEKMRKKMEAELEAKFLQELLDKYMPAPLVIEEEELQPIEAPSKEMVKVVHECVENAFHTFVFDECCFTLEPKMEKVIKVYFKNIDYAGYYYEKYCVKFFEDVDNSPQFFCTATRDLIIHGEVTGNFITVSPVTLDFGICVYDSIYQVEFTVCNTAAIPHGLTVKVPSSLKKYLYTNGTDFYVPSCHSRNVFLRFSPKKDIVKDKNRYFNSETSVLEFPIYVAVVSKQFLDTPHNRITVYAILTESNGIILTPEDFHYAEVNESNEYVLNMGECSTKETIYTNITLTNTSLAVQHFGFVDLPESVTISPNYGYGIIMPLETKTVTVMFSPETKDIANFFLDAETAITEIIFPISVETVKNKGGVRKTVKEISNGRIKSLKDSSEIIENELQKDTSSQMYQEILCCLHKLTDSDFMNSLSPSESLSTLALNWKLLEKSANLMTNEEVMSTNSIMSYKMTAESNRLWLMVKITTPYTDLSHQLVRFPDTPCGSYSIARIDFRNFIRQTYEAHCICGYVKRNTKAKNYRCAIKFEIAGDDSQITIEPFCGHLDPDDEYPQETGLYLVAKPQVPPEVVEEQAKAIKRQEIIDRKMEILLEKRQKELEAKLRKQKGKEKGAKIKKNKKGSSDKESTETEIKMPPLPQIMVKDEEIKINIFDLYPAEMALWRNFEPYEIKSRFVCTVDYLCTNSNKKRDKLYLDAICKVVQPDFTLNLRQQRINFGPVPIGMSTKKVISIQNIQHDPIHPNVSILSPIGSFFCPIPNNLKLESEHILNIPITFAPNEPKEETQFFEIRAGRSVCTLALYGEGVTPNLKFNPDFVVCRLETPFGNFTEFNVEINNKTQAPVIINFIKTCELEGHIRSPEPPGDKDKKDKKAKKDKSTTKGKKVAKYSQDLTNDEIYSLEQFFSTRPEEESPLFDVCSKDDLPNLNPNSKKNWTIRFGVLPKQVVEQKKGKDGKKKNDKKSKEKKCGPEKPGAKEAMYYISKFNVTLGDSTVLKDIIVIAKFCK